MTTYTTVFGGDTIAPSEYQFRAFNLTSDISLSWPDNTDGSDLVASLMNITPSGGVWTITLPAANQVSSGRDFLMRNLGAVDFNVVDYSSGAVSTVAAGESKYFYIADNSTQAGTWTVITYGTGSSSADASSLDGYGLTVLSGKLHSDFPISGLGTPYTVSSSDRAQFLIYTAGTISWYLPAPTGLPNGFYCAISNSGTGSLTLDASTYGGSIDNEPSKMIQPGESLFVVNSGTEWFSVGYGRSSEFAFTQLAVDVTGTGGITITSAQATNKLWYFYNTAGGDRTVTIPAVASVYFVRVGSIGAGNDLTFTTGSGSTVSLSANQSYTIYCDGTNVVSAQTVAVTSTVALDDGSASTPSLSFSLDTDTGIYREAVNVIGLTVGGSKALSVSSAGLSVVNNVSASSLSVSSPVTVANGGTGVGTLTGYVKASGTSAFTASSTIPGSDLTGNISGNAANVTGVVAVANGGTGSTTASDAFDALAPSTTKGDLIAHNGTDNVRVPVGTDAQVLSSDSLSPSGLSWKTVVDLGVLTLPVPVVYGGTNANNASQALTNLAPSTTKGDLLVFDGTSHVRLPVGTDGHTLTADSASPAGLKYTTAGNVYGPPSSTVSNIATYDSTTGKSISDSGVPVSRISDNAFKIHLEAVM